MNLSKYLAFVFVLLISSLIVAQDEKFDKDKQATEPRISFDWKWGVAQLIPSPEWISIKSGVKFGMRWQITPMLYSFGINKKLSPWRYFITDPLARQSGSAELFISPEYLNIGDSFKNKWLFRYGLRTYLPIWQKGDYASVSMAVSYYNINGNNGISYEGGIYLFAGILGFQTTYSPHFINSEWIFTIRLRYF